MLNCLAKVCKNDPHCHRAQRTIYTMMRRQSHLPRNNVSRAFIPELQEDSDSGNNPVGAAEQEDEDNTDDDDLSGGSSKGGWQRVKAAFDEVDAGFHSDEEGTLYNSTSSGNTCALVNCSFSGNDHAAWEFELVSDSYGDECSVFGAARKPLSSRCYSSSSDLWMRRAYNGYMYCQGRGVSPSLERIHQGDIVRCEFDAKAGTLAYGVNGNDPEVYFTGITDPLYPAVGSYRSGVQVRLVKVEVFRLVSHSQVHQAVGHLDWLLAPDLQSRGESDILCSANSLGPSKPSADVDVGILTARGDVGVHTGVHDWSFELKARSRAPYSFGIFQGRENLVPMWSSQGL